MSNLERLNRISYDFSSQFANLEEVWVHGHRHIQNALDALGVTPVVPLEGLREFLARGLDESFERESNALNAAFDEAVKDL
jgi:hypothetical protein